MSAQSDLANGETTTRSYVLFVSASFSYDDFTSGVGLPLCTLPVGALVAGGYTEIATAWDGTTDTLEVGDVTDPNEYVSALDAQVAVVTPFVLANMFQAIATGAITPAIVAATDEILIEITTVGTAAAGAGSVGIFYVDPTKADENYE